MIEFSNYAWFTPKVRTHNTCPCNRSWWKITPCVQVGQQVAHQATATNHFVYTGEFLQKFLSPQQNSVAAKCCTNSIWLILCDLILWQNSVVETKICAKILQYTQSDLSLQLVAWCVPSLKVFKSCFWKTFQLNANFSTKHWEWRYYM